VLERAAAVAVLAFAIFATSAESDIPSPRRERTSAFPKYHPLAYSSRP
jgi:hypothetical protein